MTKLELFMHLPNLADPVCYPTSPWLRSQCVATYWPNTTRSHFTNLVSSGKDPIDAVGVLDACIPDELLEFTPIVAEINFDMLYTVAQAFARPRRLVPRSCHRYLPGMNMSFSA